MRSLCCCADPQVRPDLPRELDRAVAAQVQGQNQPRAGRQVLAVHPCGCPRRAHRRARRPGGAREGDASLVFRADQPCTKGSWVGNAEADSFPVMPGQKTLTCLTNNGSAASQCYCVDQAVSSFAKLSLRVGTRNTQPPLAEPRSLAVCCAALKQGDSISRVLDLRGREGHHALALEFALTFPHPMGDPMLACHLCSSTQRQRCVQQLGGRRLGGHAALQQR